VLVVGDEATLKVHVHTDEPELAVALFDGAGEVSRLDVADMREQVEARDARLARSEGSTGIVAVVSGEGMARLYTELGAHVVDGGPTLNPSTYELLAGIHEVAAPCVLVLPNSRNVVMAAERAAALSEKDARVLSCLSQQAGLVVMVDLDPEAGGDENSARLTEALAGVRTAAVAPAARDDAAGRFVRGDAVGFVEDEVVAWGGAGSTLAEALGRVTAGAEIVTVIEGAEAPIPLDGVRERAPGHVELELHRGGQAHYWWLIVAQ
jgi:hypothetical protein